MSSKLGYKFIYLLGPEGVGKTTMARLLSDYMRVKGVSKITVTEVRSSHLHVYLLKSILMKMGRVEYYKYPHGVLIPRIDRLYLNRIIRPLLFMELTALITVILIRVKLRLLLGYIVICTRYVIDSLVDLLAYTLVAPQGRSLIYKLIAPMLLRLMPDDSVIICLSADYDDLVKRYRERGSYIEPHNWITFYENISRKILKKLPGHYKLVMINTHSKDRLQVFNEIIRSVS